MVASAKKIIISLSLLLSVSVYGQHKTDTINLVLGLKDLGLFEEMYSLLSVYRQAHPNDVNIEWLYAQSACFTGRTKEMIAVYESNISKHADNYYLQLDYAFKLTEAGELQKAESHLLKHLEGDKRNAKIHEYLAKIYYWRSDYKKAESHIAKAKELIPDDPSILKLEKDIRISQAVFIKAKTGRFKDNQPIARTNISIAAGKAINPFFLPELSYAAQFIDTSGSGMQTHQISLANTSYFAKPQIVLQTKIGLLHFPSGESKFLWMAGIERTFFKYIKFALKAERNPYLLMKSTLDTAMLSTDVYAGISYSKPKGFMGEVAYMANLFSDGNAISTAMAWVVSPPISLWKFNLHTGYGFGFTTSAEDRFSQIKSNDELFIDIYFDEHVDGTFSPYMTPIDQKVHSVVGVLSITPFPFINISISGSYGFKASIETPYLYGYYDADFNVVVKRGYYTESFNPYEINANAQIKLWKRGNLTIAYKHTNPNYYYKTDFIECSLQLNLAHAK